jgi:hypothetical protein
VIDFNKVNVTLTDTTGTTFIGWVANAGGCPSDQLAWYYDAPSAPGAIHLCPNACDTVRAAATGARIGVVLGCMDTVQVR